MTLSRHNSVYGELLISDRGVRNRLLPAYDRMHDVPVVSHEDVVAFVRARRLHGRVPATNRFPRE